MTSVVGRIASIKQPRNGYIKPSTMNAVVFNDGITLHEKENIHSSLVGEAVDYLTRFVMGTDKEKAFKISLRGAKLAEEAFGFKHADRIAHKLMKKIKKLDRRSIIFACKLVSFDVWYRNPMAALTAPNYKTIKPDKQTIENIITLVNRNVSFFKKYGPITSDGFTFAPVTPNIEEYKKMMETGKGSFGGYTALVNTGDGDFLTADTLWDLKVSKSKPQSRHTLQILMYWIMGQHSGQEIFKNITKIGIYNPRLNMAFQLDISEIPEDVIKTVEVEVIGYK